METSRSPQACADILQRALTAACDDGDCRLRQVDNALSVEFLWTSRLALGVDLAGQDETTFVRIRYALQGSARWMLLAALPVTFGLFLAAGFMLSEQVVMGISNVLLFGGMGLLLALLEGCIFWTILALPAFRLVRELGRALGAEEVSAERFDQAVAAFATLDANVSSEGEETLQ
jgi:hypothetical protein